MYISSRQVESLIGRIERLGRRPLHSNVGVALDRWLACIKELQSLRKNEINSGHGSPIGSYGCKSFNDQGTAISFLIENVSLEVSVVHILRILPFSFDRCLMLPRIRKSFGYKGACIFNRLQKTTLDEISILLFNKKLKLSKTF